MSSELRLRAGEWVEVLGKSEILRTLDENGRLEGLPFMPEMFQHCGRRFRVFKRAHKTCDPPNGLGGRRMASAVHLEDIRCDGQAHGGCQAGCLVFWKEAWLKRVSDVGESPREALTPNQRSASVEARDSTGGCSERDVWAGVFRSTKEAAIEEPLYVCQSTQVSNATEPLPWWDPRQYVEDYTSGNVRLSQMLAALLFTAYINAAEAGTGLGSAMRWAYDRFQALRGGTPYPCRVGRIRNGKPTPSARLDLRPDERVRVRSYQDILATLNEKSHNRGMYFDAEAVVFCGGTHEVLRRVERIIDEKTGRMLNLKNDAIILKGVVCEARYAKCRRFCPRSIYAYWREVWLERVSD
jgi:hypothetical protein